MFTMFSPWNVQGRKGNFSFDAVADIVWILFLIAWIGFALS